MIEGVSSTNEQLPLDKYISMAKHKLVASPDIELKVMNDRSPNYFVEASFLIR